MIESKIMKELPQLYKHFENVGLPISLLTIDWVIGLFLNYLPLQLTGDYLDVFFAKGSWTTVHTTTLELLRCQEECLLQMRDPGEIVNLLKTCSTAHTFKIGSTMSEKVSFLMTPSSGLLDSVALQSELTSDIHNVKLNVDTRARITGTTFGLDETPAAVSDIELESPVTTVQDIDLSNFKVKAR